MITAKTGDIFAQKNEEVNQWTLIQVIHESAINQLILLNLDGFYDEIPKPKEICNPKPFVINHHSWNKKIDFTYVKNNSIPDFVKYVTNIPPIMNADLSNSIGQEWLNGTYDKKWYDSAYNHDWPKNFLQIALEYKWNLIDEPLRASYKKALNSDQKIKIGNDEVPVKKKWIRLKSGDLKNIEELNSLNALSEIDFNGTNPDLIEFLHSKPFINTLMWYNHGETRLDFSTTYITKLMLDVSHLENLILNNRVRFLSIFGDFSNISNLKIEIPKDGANLEIYTMKIIEKVPDFGLKNLESFSFWVKNFNLDDLVESHPNLKYLSITGDPGSVQNFKSLSKLKNLETLSINDIFGFTSEGFPNPKELPKLQRLKLSSIPKEVGSYIKTNFKHLKDLEVRQLRDKKWLTENLNNPFRDWEDREEISSANFKKAFSSFKKLNTSISKDLSVSELKEKFITFIQVFNQMDEKSNCIGTIEREEIYEIYMDLADQSKLESTMLFNVFEKNRMF